MHTEEENETYKKKSYSEEPLLKKYNLVVEQLDYKYIGTCTKAKELEKIIHVLESGQEGNYPDLIKFARNRLSAVNPKSKILRETVQIINKSDLPNENKANLVSEIEEYLLNVNTDNQELITQTKMNIKSNDPPIRETKTAEMIKKQEKPTRIKSMDYKTWDKFDVDTKLLEMDLEEKRIIMENEKKAQIRKKLNKICINKNISTNAELSKFAKDLCNTGKECLAEKDYENALYYYNNSIAVKPTNEAYAYRGLTFAKQGKYTNAISDTSKVLQIDPNNSVAVYGKAIALKGMNKYKEAMDCLDNLMKIDPNCESYQKLANELQFLLRKNEQNTLRTVRLKIN